MKDIILYILDMIKENPEVYLPAIFFCITIIGWFIWMMLK